MFSRTALAAMVAVLHLATFARADNDTRVCYDASNKILKEYKPCVSPSTQEISHCCSTMDTCAGDTLCLTQWGTLYVGACTVKDWVNGANGRNFCPKYCSSVGSDIGVCDSGNGGWDFCCGLLGGHTKCCAEQYGKRFKITGNATNERLIQRPWSNTTLASTAGPSSASASSDSSSPATSQCSTPSSDRGAQIGLGVGLGVPLLVALALLLWENRKRKNAERVLAQYSAPVEYTHHVQEGVTQATPGYQTVHSYEVDNLKGVPNELATSHVVHELGYNDKGHA